MKNTLDGSPAHLDSPTSENSKARLPARPWRRVVVIVAAYNEEALIEATIRGLQGLRGNLESRGLELSIYVVDDGSADRTRQMAREAGADRVLRHRVNLGLGAAVRTGLEAAREAGADIAVKFDADLQHDPADIPALIQPILEDEAELVYGNRFPRIEYKMSTLRRVGNQVFTSLMRWLTHWPVQDSQPGLFAISRTYLARFYLPGDYNYTQQLLLDAYHKGMRFAQVPIAFRKRREGESFVSLKYPFKVLPQIVMLLVGIKPMRVFVPLSLAFLGPATAVFCFELFSWFMGHADKPVEHVNLVLGLALFGLQTLFFGILAQLVIARR